MGGHIGISTRGEGLLLKKIIIIGAPRSGTNMLRNVLCKFDGVATWPCDEINYIWRHGNVSYPSDEIPVERATADVQAYILRKFDWVAQKYGVDKVVEKTCANCLRVPFVDQIVSGAKYIYIYRDGIDTVGSARLRWKAKLNIPYIFQKARFVPVLDLPYYATRYLWNRMYHSLSGEKRLAFWGPVLTDMDKITKQYTLNEICGLQWQRCIELAENAFNKMPAKVVLHVRYEDFVCSPNEEMIRILSFLDMDVPARQISGALSGVSNSSIGKGRISLSAGEVAQLKSLIGKTMDRYGYR